MTEGKKGGLNKKRKKHWWNSSSCPPTKTRTFSRACRQVSIVPQGLSTYEEALEICISWPVAGSSVSLMDSVISTLYLHYKHIGGICRPVDNLGGSERITMRGSFRMTRGHELLYAYIYAK